MLIYYIYIVLSINITQDQIVYMIKFEDSLNLLTIQMEINVLKIYIHISLCIYYCNILKCIYFTDIAHRELGTFIYDVFL
jgi:hypothetical protein